MMVNKAARLKQAIRKVFSNFGYMVVRDSGDAPHVRFENFHSLAQAYEQFTNETKGVTAIRPSEVRSKLLARLQGTPPGEAYFIVDALARTERVEGDVCEFGVAQGETSTLIATEIRGTAKVLHLFDSFEGLPKPTEKDELKDDIYSLGSMASYEGTMSCPQDMVISRLKAVGFPESRYVIHAGFIEKTLPRDHAVPARVSFAYVDFDLYEPVLTALEFLNGVTPPGAVIVVDDYGFFSTGVKTAVDEFIGEKNGPEHVYDLHVPDHKYGYFAIITRAR